MTTRIDALIERIRDEILLSGVDLSRLARMAGLHRNSMLGIRRRNWFPTINTLRRLDRALQKLQQQQNRQLASPNGPE